MQQLAALQDMLSTLFGGGDVFLVGTLILVAAMVASVLRPEAMRFPRTVGAGQKMIVVSMIVVVAVSVVTSLMFESLMAAGNRSSMFSLLNAVSGLARLTILAGVFMVVTGFSYAPPRRRRGERMGAAGDTDG